LFDAGSDLTVAIARVTRNRFTLCNRATGATTFQGTTQLSFRGLENLPNPFLRDALGLADLLQGLRFTLDPEQKKGDVTKKGRRSA
jgi:hypothetical protein